MATELPIELTARPGAPLGVPTAAFLRHYWQRKPLLVRAAYPDFECPLNGDDLAALAMQEQALSRLLRHHRRGDRWTVRNGPFVAEDFSGLPDKHWTLLVQDVDKWDPDVASLLSAFDFLPSWRIDDIMVSFAAPGGSVGAHVDHYDVFLLQGLGHRRWAIDASGQAKLSYRDDAPIKLLQQFNPSHEWLLNPGDMLYLPPNVPHHGVATDPCLTLSIGMRAPAAAELLGPLIEEHAQRLGEEQRFTDAGRAIAADPRGLEDLDVERVRALLSQSLADLQRLPTAELADFYARFVSQYRQARAPVAKTRKPSLAAISKALAQDKVLAVPPWFKALRRSSEPAQLYLGGLSTQLTPQSTEALLADGIDTADWAQLGAAEHAALRELLAQGLLELRR